MREKNNRALLYVYNTGGIGKDILFRAMQAERARSFAALKRGSAAA
jgi:hypothetical protein